MDYDLKALYPQVSLQLPTITAADGTNCTGFDFKNYQGKLLVTMTTNQATTANDTLVVKIQDSPNNANWTDVTGGAFTQVNNNAASIQQISVDTRATNRYLRAVITTSGTNANYTVGVLANGMLKYNPDGVNTAT